MAEQIHICGQCEEQFNSEEGYLSHECEATGQIPGEPISE
jgi:hypothetical protein